MIAGGLRRLTSGLGELGDVNSSFRFSMYISDMVEALGRIGRVGQGLSALEVAIEHAEETEERWSIAELLRIKCELLLSRGASAPRQKPRNSFGERSIGRAGKAPCPGNYAPPRASRGCCAIRADPVRGRNCSSPSTIGSPRGWRPSI